MERAFRVSTRRQRQSAAVARTDDAVEYTQDEYTANEVDTASNPSPLAESHAVSEGEESSAEPHESTTGLEAALEARKVLPNEQRLPTWQMKQCDSTFCVECDAPVTNGRATNHVYMKHMDDYPYVCGVCGDGRYGTDDMKTHFDRDHAEEEVCFDDKREEIEQDFLVAYFSCYALKSNANVNKDIIGDDGRTRRSQAPGDAKRAAPPTPAPRRQILQARKVSAVGRRVPTWQMQQRDSTFCIECSRPVGMRAIQHVYTEHVRGHPFVCRLCSHGCSETSDMRLHFGRRHADADVAFDDKRDELEQDFLHAFLACYALRPDVEEASVTHKQPVDLNTVDSSAPKRRCDDSESEVTDSRPSTKRRMRSICVAGDLSELPAGNPAIYELGETVPIFKPTWQMRQRDVSFCRLCNVATSSSGATNHINRVHLSRLPYACSVCGLRIGIPSRIKTHANRLHNGKSVQLLDYRLSLQQEFEETHALCYRVRPDVELSADATTHKVETSGEFSASSNLLVESTSNGEMERVTSEVYGIGDRLQVSEDRALSAEPDRTATERCDKSDTQNQKPTANCPVNYKLGDPLPKVKPTWQMLQRDIRFCVLCEISLNPNKLLSKNI